MLIGDWTHGHERGDRGAVLPNELELDELRVCALGERGPRGDRAAGGDEIEDGPTRKLVRW